MSEQSRVSEEKKAVFVSHDCNGPWEGHPHCESKMTVSDLLNVGMDE